MHRSGTTLLASALSSSGGVSGLSNTNVRMGEGQFLQDVYLPGYEMGGVTGWAFDERAYLTEKDAHPSWQTRELWDSWSPYWDLSAPVLLEKTPLNITKTRFLQALFPHASFVIITRHPLTQALAIMKWYPDIPGKLGRRFDLLFEHWLRAHEALRADVGHLDDVTIVRYEDITRDPVAVATYLDDRLNLTVDKAEFAAFDTERAREYERRWDGRARGKAAPDRPLPLSWVTSLALSSAAPRIRARFEERVNALGYSMDDAGAAENWD